MIGGGYIFSPPYKNKGDVENYAYYRGIKVTSHIMKF